MKERGDDFYSPGTRGFRPNIQISCVDDLITAGIMIFPEIVQRRWGNEAAQIYQEAMAARIRNQMLSEGFPIPSVPFGIRTSEVVLKPVRR